MALEPYSVYGCWRETRERFAGSYQATSPRAAENVAQRNARNKAGTLWVCRVVAGLHAPASRSTAFVDPDDDRNLYAEGLEPDMPSLEGDPEWTVFGIAVPAGTADDEVWRTGERYGDVIAATGPRAAEDVACDRLADRGGVLWACVTLTGAVTAADSYAVFVDPDVRDEAAGRRR